ncbi:MAG: alpha-L-fucosidase [Candidatus Latescibacteria bacterium]|nr:alpha-L-fucosidase [Candidatus Latescibacterota bacterium]
MSKLNFLKILAVVVLLFCIITVSAYAQKTYEPTWESLDSRPIPQWYDDAKFGIKICWGLFSVPAWAPTIENLQDVSNKNYAEWYWYNISDRMGHHRRYHAGTYGGDFQYQHFAPMFKAELWEPKEWAELIKRAGAKYIILITKHHDGYCLWPNTESWNWNSVNIGPHRDIVGELTKAIKAEGIKMGMYYSLYEWYNPLYNSDVDRYVEQHMIPQMKDLITRYEPDLFYGDGEWDHPSEVWKTREFLTWLFNESSIRDHVVINDRWGNETRSHHGGYYLSEYFKYTGENAQLGPKHKWAETRSMSASFGYNRNEDIENYQTAEELIHLLVNCVCRGGNLCLDIGPSADGKIPVIMQERLLQIGGWLDVNGEAIYGTRVWHATNDGENICYTAKDGEVYAICLKWPGKILTLETPKTSGITKVSMLGYDGDITWRNESGKMHIDVPQLSVDEMPCRYAYTFKLSGVK